MRNNVIKPIKIQAQVYLFLLSASLLLSSCSSCFLFPPKPYVPPRNETKTIVFKCDRHINSGMALPVDVIYVTAEDDIKKVTEVGPDAWFESKDRENRPFKETLMLKGGEEINLELSKPPETKFIVIFASYYQVQHQKEQQVILTPNAKEEEVIWVGTRALYH
jgi:hypothetical protein